MKQPSTPQEDGNGDIISRISVPAIIPEAIHFIGDDVGSVVTVDIEYSYKEWMTAVILFFINLLNYINRYIVASILHDLQIDFEMGDLLTGLLQSVFITSHMVFAPVFGFLGDRYSRKYLLASGAFLCGFATLAGSFIRNYWFFLALRAVVALGDANYTTIAPAVICDLSLKTTRTIMLTLFYFAIPFGAGLGFVVGSQVTVFTGCWRWSFRATPLFSVVACFLLLFAIKDPQRGILESPGTLRRTSLKTDLMQLAKNYSFVFCVAGSTCVCFLGGALGWWGARIISLGTHMQSNAPVIKTGQLEMIFGIIAMVGGVIGIFLGFILSKALKKFPRGDPLICAGGLFASAPLLLGSLLISTVNSVICYTLLLLSQIFFNFIWAVTTDILLSVVVPTRRSLAKGVQILVSHAFGDGVSPVLIGLFSEYLVNIHQDTKPNENFSVRYWALLYALMIAIFIEVLGGICFVFNSIFIIRDKKNTHMSIRRLSVSVRRT